MKNLYKLQVETGATLSNKVGNAHNRKVMDSRIMVGKHRSSKQVPQKKAGKSSNSEGVVVAAENMVVLKTDPRGRGSSRNTFLAKREC